MLSNLGKPMAQYIFKPVSPPPHNTSGAGNQWTCSCPGVSPGPVPSCPDGQGSWPNEQGKYLWKPFLL